MQVDCQDDSICCDAGSAAKVPAKESMEELVPHLITFLLTHPEVKSIKQVRTSASKH